VKREKRKRKRKKKKAGNKVPRLNFKRLPNGHDLLAEHKLSLIEALLGFEFAFRHLDDRIVIVKSRTDHVTSSGELVTIEGEGMPLPKRGVEKGDLYIKLTVTMPQHKDLGSAENKVKLRSLLPKVPELPSGIGPEREEYVAKQFDEAAQIAKAHRDREQQRQAHEEDDEDGRGHTQCRAQ